MTTSVPLRENRVIESLRHRAIEEVPEEADSTLLKFGAPSCEGGRILSEWMNNHPQEYPVQSQLGD